MYGLPTIWLPAAMIPLTAAGAAAGAVAWPPGRSCGPRAGGDRATPAAVRVSAAAHAPADAAGAGRRAAESRCGAGAWASTLPAPAAGGRLDLHRS